MDWRLMGSARQMAIPPLGSNGAEQMGETCREGITESEYETIQTLSATVFAILVCQSKPTMNLIPCLLAARFFFSRLDAGKSALRAVFRIC